MIRAEHFYKNYGKFPAAHDISFEVRQGEVFALLGPNGSGKTTTLKAIVGLNIPTSGRILINGVDVQKAPKETKIDLLLIGGHRHRGLKDIFFGASVSSVRHQLSIPVLVVQ